MSAPILNVIREQYHDALTVLAKNPDANTRAYYEGRRDVLAELLNTVNVIEKS